MVYKSLNFLQEFNYFYINIQIFFFGVITHPWRNSVAQLAFNQKVLSSSLSGCIYGRVLRWSRSIFIGPNENMLLMGSSPSLSISS